MEFGSGNAEVGNWNSEVGIRKWEFGSGNAEFGSGNSEVGSVVVLVLVLEIESGSNVLRKLNGEPLAQTWNTKIQ